MRVYVFFWVRIDKMTFFSAILLLSSCCPDKNMKTRTPQKQCFEDDVVYIPGGTVHVGTDRQTSLSTWKLDGEGPAHEEIVDSFYIMKYEVSNEQFSNFVNTTNYITDSETFG